jgi:rhamnose transport system ATP-binding protein
MEEHEKPIVTTEKISKDFNGVRVLSDIDFEIRLGEIHAVVGENGAGKSTLMKIIAGVHLPSEGKVLVETEAVVISSPHTARDLGIALIHQEPLIFSDLDVTENIFVGHTRKSQGMFIDWKIMYSEAKRLLDSLDVHLNPRVKMKGMSIADQQMVEIISALSQNAKLLIMDEPTASLTPGEVKTLFSIVTRLKEQGKAIVFISHRLDEVKSIADVITVLRDGKKVGTYKSQDVTKNDIIKMMIGREMSELIQKDNTEKGVTALKVEKLYLEGVFGDISFEVREGEILGVAGLVGAGRSEVARAVFGLTPPESGNIQVYGKEINIKNPEDAIRQGIAYVPEDRQYEGLFLPFTIASNMSYAVPKKISKRGWLNFKKEREMAEEYKGKLQIRLRDVGQAVKELSGGNQQKVVIAKWLLTGPRVLILDEPTRGIDVGAKMEVYKMINQLASQGKAIVMISSELPEILSLSDNVIVMKEGRITGRFTRGEASDEKIMTAATANAKEEVSA